MLLAQLRLKSMFSIGTYGRITRIVCHPAFFNVYHFNGQWPCRSNLSVGTALHSKLLISVYVLKLLEPYTSPTTSDTTAILARLDRAYDDSNTVDWESIGSGTAYYMKKGQTDWPVTEIIAITCYTWHVPRSDNVYAVVQVTTSRNRSTLLRSAIG